MNRTVLITGASNGIGYELSNIMAEEGWNLVLTARSGDKLNQLADVLRQKSGIKVRVMAKDLSKRESAGEIFEELGLEGIEVDALVNNAGFGDHGAFHETDWVKNEEMINLNITTLTRLTHLFLPGMVERGSGKIMNVASTAAFQPGPTMAVYYATKAYVLHFSEAIAHELKDTGVTVTALCPGPTQTGFQEKASMEGSRLFKFLKVPNAYEVAMYGYKAMINEKKVAVPGILNKFLSKSISLFPRNMVTAVSGHLTKKG